MAELVLFILGGTFAFHRTCPCGRPYDAHDRVPTIEVNDQQLRADLYLPQLVVGGVGRGLCIDVSRVHDFHGNAANPSLNGTLRHADINHVLSHRAQEKIDKYRAGYAATDVRKAFLPAG